LIHSILVNAGARSTGFSGPAGRRPLFRHALPQGVSVHIIGLVGRSMWISSALSGRVPTPTL
jgi:hypothetical protein